MRRWVVRSADRKWFEVFENAVAGQGVQRSMEKCGQVRFNFASAHRVAGHMSRSLEQPPFEQVCPMAGPLWPPNYDL